MFERIVAKQLSDHKQENDVLEQFQSAYRQHDSTETALIKVHCHILSAVGRGCVVVLVMLDLTAAFDTIDHAIQLSKLTHNCGVTGAALKWFTPYFSGRQQPVCIDSDKPSPTPVPFGVPQGSLLGPLLFTAYISPLGDIIKKFGMDYHLYADDAQLYVSFCPGGDDQLNAIDRLCSCLGEIGKWSPANLLKLNDEKTDVVVFGTKHKLNDEKTDVVVFGTKHKLNDEKTDVVVFGTKHKLNDEKTDVVVFGTKHKLNDKKTDVVVFGTKHKLNDEKTDVVVFGTKHKLTDEKTDVVVFGTKHKLNDEKTDVVVFGTKHKLPQMKDIRITIGAATLNASSNVRNLGVVFDSSL